MATPQGKYNNWWCAAPGAGIEKPADVAGKKVHIFAPNSLAQVVTRTVLRKHGVLPGQYEELNFTFDQAVVTATHVQQLVRAFTYKDSSTATGFTSGREIAVQLFDTNGDFAEAFVNVGDVIAGTAGSDTFTAEELLIGPGDQINGGNGTDTLNPHP